jgi:ketosteroid isomerase-like protein
MNRVLLATALGGMLLFAGACKSKTDGKDAIRDGVVKHIAAMNGLNLNNMTITVTQATINGDTAQASVDIRAKNGDPSAPPMQLVYQMQKQGNQWVVVKGQPTGGMQHPAPGEVPPPGTMPPGHPATGGTSGQMPANHPNFNSILNTAQPPAQTQQQPPQPQQPAQQPQAQKPSGSYNKP